MTRNPPPTATAHNYPPSNLIATRYPVLHSPQFQAIYTSASAMHGCRQMAAGGSGRVALPVKALKAGQEAYWLDQIARNREEYFSGRGESPGRFVGSAAQASDLEGLATSKALKADVRAVQAACRLGGAKRVKVETVERLCRKVLDTDPRE